MVAPWRLSLCLCCFLIQTQRCTLNYDTLTRFFFLFFLLSSPLLSSSSFPSSSLFFLTQRRRRRRANFFKKRRSKFKFEILNFNNFNFWKYLSLEISLFLVKISGWLRTLMAKDSSRWCSCNPISYHNND